MNDNLSRIEALLADSNGSIVPVPARYVGELMFSSNVTHWWDREIGIDRIKKFEISGDPIGGSCVTITGPINVGGYEPEDMVGVAIRPGEL